MPTEHGLDISSCRIQLHGIGQRMQQRENYRKTLGLLDANKYETHRGPGQPANLAIKFASSHSLTSTWLASPFDRLPNFSFSSSGKSTKNLLALIGFSKVSPNDYTTNK
mmetsp:Transcript_15344/g.29297  ORF Transcript_15344/g.29297 Transcript_15344/m.29297 type:complete len:109 (-) Transcript_15344:1775-2101(-)